MFLVGATICNVTFWVFIPSLMYPIQYLTTQKPLKHDSRSLFTHLRGSQGHYNTILRLHEVLPNFNV